MKKNTIWISLGILIALLVFIGIFFSRQKETAPVQETPLPTSTKGSSDDVSVAEEGEELTVEGEEFSYSPSKLKVKPGVVTITFKNVGEMGHDLVFEDLEAATKVISPGEEETVTVEIKEQGTYVFYCSVGNHRQLGMEGELVVE